MHVVNNRVRVQGDGHIAKYVGGKCIRVHGKGGTYHSNKDTYIDVNVY